MQTTTPDHPYQPERKRWWHRFHFKFYWRCAVEGCTAIGDAHSPTSGILEGEGSGTT